MLYQLASGVAVSLYVRVGDELVLAKFFESDLPFTLKGLTLIGSGVAFVMLNVVLVRIRKGRRA